MTSSAMRLILTSLSFAFSSAALATPCGDFASAADAWLSAGPDRVVRTKITAAVGGHLFEGFTFSDYVPSTTGRFALPSSLKKDQVTLRSMDGTQPELVIGYRFPLNEPLSLSVRNVTAGVRLDGTTFSTCKYVSGADVWQLVTPGTGGSNQYLFEMKFDTRPR